jgi:hypothetical protein
MSPTSITEKYSQNPYKLNDLNAELGQVHDDCEELVEQCKDWLLYCCQGNGRVFQS